MPDIPVHENQFQPLDYQSSPDSTPTPSPSRTKQARKGKPTTATPVVRAAPPVDSGAGKGKTSLKKPSLDAPAHDLPGVAASIHAPNAAVRSPGPREATPTSAPPTPSPRQDGSPHTSPSPASNKRRRKANDDLGRSTPLLATPSAPVIAANGQGAEATTLPPLPAPRTPTPGPRHSTQQELADLGTPQGAVPELQPNADALGDAEMWGEDDGEISQELAAFFDSNDTDMEETQGSDHATPTAQTAPLHQQAPDLPSTLIDAPAQIEVDYDPKKYRSIVPLVAAPDDGFPVVEFSDPRGLFDNMQRKQVEDWMNLYATHPAIGVYLWDHGVPHVGHVSNRIDKIKWALTSATGYTGMKVSIPAALNEPGRASDKTTKKPPHLHVIWDIDYSFRDYLLAKRVLASKHFAFLFFPVETLIPSFLFGIAYLNYDEDLPEARRIVIRAWNRSELVTRLIPIIAECPEHAGSDPAMVARRLIRDVRVQSLPTKNPFGGLSPILNVYVNKFTNDEKAFRAIRDYLATLTYGDSFSSYGVIHEGFKCTRCHGCDHPRGMCPFLKVPGWLLNDSAEGTDDEDDSETFTTVAAPPRGGQSRGRGGRGRGDRGRGGRGQQTSRGARGGRGPPNKSATRRDPNY